MAKKKHQERRLPKPPVAWWSGNITVDRSGTVRAMYLLDRYTYEHVSAEGQMEHWQRLYRALCALENVEEVCIHLVRRQTPVYGVIPLPHAAHPDLASVAGHYRDRMIAELRKRMQEPTACEWVVSVRLRQPTYRWQGVVHGAKWAMRELRRQSMEGKMGVPVLSEEARAAYVVQEDQIYQLLRRNLRVTRADTATCEWLVRRAYWRGIPGEPPVRRNWTPKLTSHLDSDGHSLNFTPEIREVLSLSDAPVEFRYNHVVTTQLVDGKWQTGYHRIFCLGAIPDEMNTGCAWAYQVVENLPYPVELVLRLKPVDHRKTQQAVQKRQQEIDNQASEAENAGHVEDDLTLAAGDAAAYVAKLKEERAPSFLMNFFMIVSAPTVELLDQRSSQLEELMRDLTLPLEKPQGDMELAFLSTIPGAPLVLRDYELRVTPEFIASSAAGASAEVGDPDGAFMGWTRSGLPVYENPTRGAQVNEALSGASVGRLGGGKTFVWRLKIIQALLFYQARGLYVDPKGETDEWLDNLPWLKKIAHKIALTPGSNCDGLLDLLAMARAGGSREMAAQLALSVLSSMFNLRAGDEEMDDLADAINAALDLAVPSMEGVIEALERVATGDQDRRARMARRLRNWRNIGLGRALFGRPDTEPISAKSVLTVLQLQHVPLPPEDRSRDDYTPQDVINSAIMMASIAFANWFILQNRSEFCFVFVDEGWSIISNKQGAHMVKFLIRTGRANKKAVWIASQMAGDLKDEKANLGVKYLFRGRDKAEVTKQLEFAGLPVSDDNIQTINDLANGEALMVDIYGRAAVVQIDALFADLIRAFDTRPPAQMNEGESA